MSSVSRPAACFSNVLRCRKDALEVHAQLIVLRVECYEQVVEEAPPLPWSALHELQIIRCEHRHPKHAEQIAGPVQPLFVDEHTIAAAAVDLGLDQDLAPVVVANRGPYDRLHRTESDQRIGRSASKALQRGEVGEGLGEVRLSLTVVPEHRRDAVHQLELGRGVVPEVGEGQALDEHAVQGTLTGIRR